MNSPILEALPALHVTIIGVVAAFFSAFAIYAYQKVNDAKEKFEAALKHGMSVSTPTSMIFSGNNVFLNQDGRLNWDDVGKNTLRKATGLYSHLFYEEKYGIKPSIYQHDPSAEEVITECNNLFMLLTTIFTSYPFWNNGHIHIEGQTEKVSKLCASDFDSTRLQEMLRIVNYLNWTWNTNKNSLMTLASKGIEYSQIKKLEKQEEIFNRQTINMTEPDKQRIRSQFNPFQAHNDTDFITIFANFFETAHIIEIEVIPLLSESLSNYTIYNETFRVKDTTLKVIRVIAFNMLFGVILPLITLKLFVYIDSKNYNFWLSYYEYFILLATMSPYLWACYFLYKKIKRLKFY